MPKEPEIVGLPGQVWGLAAADRDGPIYLTSYAGRSPSTRNLYTTVLTAVDLNGGRLWQHTFAGHPFPPRADADGTVWVAHHDDASPPVFTLTSVGADGSVLHEVTPQQEAGEYLGAVVRMPDGFCVLWLPTAPRQWLPPGRTARLARHSDTGSTMWSTPLPLETVSFSGVVEAGVATGWYVQPKNEWRPSTLQADHWQPLLVAGDRILAGISDGGSGIGRCTILDTETGNIISTTQPGPYHHKAIAGRGRFLVGAQGYGAFPAPSTALTASQPTPGPATARCSSTSPARSAARNRRTGCRPGRSSGFQPRRINARRPTSLSGYYTSYPALDANGTAVFWRDGTLLAVDANLDQHELFHRADDERTVMSRTLFLQDAAIAFALDNELLIFRDTGLAPLAAGPWPCADGNIRGNPAIPTVAPPIR